MTIDLAKYKIAPASGIDLSKYKIAAPQAAPTLATGVANAFQTRVNTAADSQVKAMQGTQSPTSAALQTVGQGAGFVGDIAMEGLKAADRTVTGGKIGSYLSKGIEKVAKTKPVQAVIGKYGVFKEEHPEAAANVEAVANIAGLVPAGKAAQLTAKVGAEAATIAGRTAGKAAVSTAKAAKSAPSGIASIATGVPRDVLQRAANPEHADMIDRAVKHIAENEKEPFLDLANRSVQGLNKVEKIAGSNLQAAKNTFREQFPKASFDVRPKIPQIVNALKPFRSSGLIVETIKDAANKVTGHTISRTVQSPFSSREVGALNNLMGKMRASKDVGIDDLLALRQSFNAAYHDIPLGNNQTPRTYHAAVMGLKADAEKAIDQILPPELRQAFKDYADVQDMKDEIGTKIADGQGAIKHTAEQFLANLGNMNKGAQRASAERFKQLTGIDIEKEVQAVKDAQKLSPLFAGTGSRTQDIVRALFASGIGGASLGPVGMAAGLAMTSPKIVGKAALGIGKYLKRAQSRSSALPSRTFLKPNAAQTAKNIKTPSTPAMPGSVPRKGPLDIWPDKPPF
jgi:hypothetical protein